MTKRILCRIFGHTGPYWLDINRQANCGRCGEPDLEWLEWLAALEKIRNAGRQ